MSVAGGAVCPSGGTHAVLPTISDDHAELPAVFSTKKSGVDIDPWADGTAARGLRAGGRLDGRRLEKHTGPPKSRQSPLPEGAGAYREPCRGSRPHYRCGVGDCRGPG